MTFDRVGSGRPAGVSADGFVTGTNPAVAEAHYEPDELEFLVAVHRYQREHGRKFPTFVEVLDVAKALGYRKVEPESPLPKYREAAPAGPRSGQTK